MCLAHHIMPCAFGADRDAGLAERHTPADSLEISRFLPSFLGKMAVFDEMDSLVMGPVQRFYCCRQYQRACGLQHRRDEPSTMGRNERSVVLLSHEYALGLACQVRLLQRRRRQEGHQQTAVEVVCAKIASSCPRNSQLLTHDDKELLTKRSCSNRMQMQRMMRTSCPTRKSFGEKELRRKLSPELFWGSAISRAARSGAQFYN